MRYSGIQLDTARYVQIQLDTVRYSGMQWIWICCKIVRYRDTAGYQGYYEIQVQDTGKMQAGDPKNARQVRTYSCFVLVCSSSLKPKPSDSSSAPPLGHEAMWLRRDAVGLT